MLFRGCSRPGGGASPWLLRTRKGGGYATALAQCHRRCPHLPTPIIRRRARFALAPVYVIRNRY